MMTGVVEVDESIEASGLCASALMYDMHFHLGFSQEPYVLAAAADLWGIGGLAVTVTPSEYEHLTYRGDGAKPPLPASIRVGLGLHPWWVADGRCGEDEIARFERLAPSAKFIGEVGLDFSPRWEGSRDAQLVAFRRVLAACVSAGVTASPKVLSLHAVHAAGEVLDELSRLGALAVHKCVFHWFSGSAAELGRAIEAGCCFSFGERALSSRRGRSYAKAIPKDRLLLETDYPSEPTGHASVEEWAASLERALLLMADARGEKVDLLAECLRGNAAALLQ